MDYYLRHRLHLLLVGFAIVALALPGCRSEELSESETEAIYDIFRSGLEMEHDEFVRAETVRALDLTDDPQLAQLASDYTDDPSEVVRVAALRTLLRSADLEAPYNVALDAFRRDNATVDERLQVLEVALTEGDETVRRALLGRAHRDDSPRIRLRALERGLLAEIEQADEAGDTEDLERELLPELGEYVDDSNPEIAATALRALLDYGREGRAERFINHFTDEDRSTDQRADAGRVLLLARAQEAEPAFRQVLDIAASDERDALGRPIHDIDDELVRIAELGLTALGDADYVEAAQQHLSDASATQIHEVLEALGHNPDEEAAISLRSDIRGADAGVRRHALELYGQRDDARSDVLFSALRRDDFETQRLGIAILTERFPDEWFDFLDEQLHSTDPGDVKQGLTLIQQMLRADEDLEPLTELVDRLEQLAMGDDLDLEADEEKEEDQLERVANQSAFVLFQISDEEGGYREVIRENPDHQTRAAYLEYLATHEPREHADILRDYLYDDLFVLRLFAATGLWNAFGNTADWPGAPDPDEEPEQQDDE